MGDRIFVYIESNGPACGKWIDLDDAEQVASDIAKFSEGRDTGVSDVEGALARAFYCARVDSFDFKGYFACASKTDEHAAVAAWLGNGNAWNEDSFQECYAGTYENLGDFAYEELEATGELKAIPEDLRRYFDYDKYGDELKRGGTVWTHETPNDNIFVFWNF